MALPVHLDRRTQFLQDTDPTKDYTKDSLAVVQARTKRIRENYLPFFQSLIGASLPEGGLAGQVLAKNSDASLDVTWKTLDIPLPVLSSGNIDGGSPDSAYLFTQKFDGGSID